MRRVYGMKVGAHYPGRSAGLPDGAWRGSDVPRRPAEVSRGHSSRFDPGEGPNVWRKLGAPDFDV